MEEKTNPPEWAIDVALERLGIDRDQTPLQSWRDYTYANAVRLAASLIAAHEQPPVDPLEAEARKLVATDIAVSRTLSQRDAILAGRTHRAQVCLVLRALRRGMELSAIR